MLWIKNSASTEIGLLPWFGVGHGFLWLLSVQVKVRIVLTVGYGFLMGEALFVVGGGAMCGYRHAWLKPPKLEYPCFLFRLN